MGIQNIKVAFLATHGFEQSELLSPKKALEAEGAKVFIVSPEKTEIKGWSKGNWAETVIVDINLDEARPEEFEALVLPGGVINPDKLRIEPKAIEFIKHFVTNNKPIAAICHGPWTLIDAKGVKGREVTSWPSLKLDLTNAGAHWVDKEVALDGNLITSRKPDDLPAFNKAIIKLFSEIQYEKESA